MLTFAKCVDTERHCGGGDPGEHDHYPGPGEGEEGVLACAVIILHTRPGHGAVGHLPAAARTASCPP